LTYWVSLVCMIFIEMNLRLLTVSKPKSSPVQYLESFNIA
jgi:hypothetical protein